ncbi:tail protein X [Sodalis sp. RH15]|uniref:tail protein X n=1 Tax=Sodalis sp. RH15 TaxID=3394330 RepID=UPI0039B37D00
MKIYALQGDTVDAICWRCYGRTQGVVEQVFAVNAGLADLGAILPHGTALELPDIPNAAVKESLQLWD